MSYRGEGENEGNPQNIGGQLRKAAKFVNAARTLLERLPERPTGDEAEPFAFYYVVRELGLLHLAVLRFEQELSTRKHLWD